MRVIRLFLVLMLSFALPFQAYALAGMRACTMSHAPIDRHNVQASIHSGQGAHEHELGHAQSHSKTYSSSQLDREVQHVSGDHANHGAEGNSCQCSTSCIGSGLISSHNLIQLEQVRPVFSQVHSQSLLQAPIKRLDRPPRQSAA